MVKKTKETKTGLGRGLDSLIPNFDDDSIIETDEFNNEENDDEEPKIDPINDKKLKTVEIDSIHDELVETDESKDIVGTDSKKTNENNDEDKTDLKDDNLSLEIENDIEKSSDVIGSSEEISYDGNSSNNTDSSNLNENITDIKLSNSDLITDNEIDKNKLTDVDSNEYNLNETQLHESDISTEESSVNSENSLNDDFSSMDNTLSDDSEINFTENDSAVVINSDIIDGETAFDESLEGNLELESDNLSMGQLPEFEFDEEKGQEVIEVVEKNPRITLWSAQSAAVLRYIRKTEPEFSISKEASKLVEEAIMEKYPEIWEKFNDLNKN